MKTTSTTLKYTFTVLLTLLTIINTNAQNVGINEENPTNTLHIKPLNPGDEPLRVEGLSVVNTGDNALLIHNPSVGVVRYITINNLSDSIINNIVNNQTFLDSMVSIIHDYGDTLLYNETFINNLQDSIDTHLDSLTLTGNILSGWVEGINYDVDITSLTGVNQTDIINIIYNYGDTLLYNSTFLTSLQDSIDTHLDSLVLNGTLLTGWVDGTPNSVDLNSLVGTDSQNLTNATLTGNVLSIDIQNGTSTSVDLSALIGSDDQNLTGATMSGNTLTIDIENGASVSVDLSGLVGTDSQTLSLAGNNLSISNGNTVSLNSLKDHDWYVANTTNQATSIGQDVFTNGLVGIGTNNPLSQLHVSGSPLMMRLENTSGTTWGLSSTNSGDFQMTNFTGSTTPLTILGSNDNVGIGTQTPTSRLEVIGDVKINNGLSDGARLIFRGGTGGTQEYRVRVATPGYLGFFPIEQGNPSYVGEPLVLTQDGKVGIGDHLTPLYALELQNQVSLFGQARANAWVTYSDERIKSDRKPIENALETVGKLNPLYYFQHSSEKNQNGFEVLDQGAYSYGFLAQELYKELPDIVFKPEDDSRELWSVDYDKLIPVLTKAIQEQQSEIEMLKKEQEKVQSQEEEIKLLKKSLEALQNQVNKLLEKTQ